MRISSGWGAATPSAALSPGKPRLATPAASKSPSGADLTVTCQAAQSAFLRGEPVPLDFDKVRADLSAGQPMRRCLLLQALRKSLIASTKLLLFIPLRPSSLRFFPIWEVGYRERGRHC